MGRDHTHPFAGGLTVLKVFHRLDFLSADLNDPVNEQNLERACELIEQSIHAPVDQSYS